jgi:hypothetical protein
MKRKILKRAIDETEQENEDFDNSVSVLIPSRNDVDWRSFVRNSMCEMKQIVLEISKDHRAVPDWPHRYFNNAIYDDDLKCNPLKPYWGFQPLSNEISQGAKNTQRIGNRLRVHRLSIKLHPFINPTLCYVGNQNITFYVYYMRAWRGRLNLEHEAMYRYNELMYDHMINNPNAIDLGVYAPNLISATSKFLDVNSLDNVQLLAKKSFNINDVDATILSPSNIQFINQIEHTKISNTGMTTWEVDIDVNAIVTYRANADYDYQMTPNQATVRPATTNVEQGMFFITYAMDINYSVDQDIDFLGNAALYYTDC